MWPGLKWIFVIQKMENSESTTIFHPHTEMNRKKFCFMFLVAPKKWHKNEFRCWSIQLFNMVRAATGRSLKWIFKNTILYFSIRIRHCKTVLSNYVLFDNCSWWANIQIYQFWCYKIMFSDSSFKPDLKRFDQNSTNCMGHCYWNNLCNFFLQHKNGFKRKIQ